LAFSLTPGPPAAPAPESDTSARLAVIDWAATALGPREGWPQSLRLAVDLCQSSRFPMFVWWGPELINLYNDAYIPMLGKRHPRAFGRPAQETWSDIWAVVGPQSDTVMKEGKATWNERVLLVMERHGYTEETYFTWSYSPIRGDDGAVAGLFCAVKEETEVVIAERERDLLLAQVETERGRLAAAFAQSPAFLAVLRGPRHVFEFVNERYCDLVGKRDLVGKPLREALPELQGQGFLDVLDRVFESGEAYVGTSVRVALRRRMQQAPDTVDLDFVYQPMRDSEDKVAGILVHGVDVTAVRRAEKRSREAEQVLELIATGAPRAQVLEMIACAMEAQSTDGMLCSILVLDDDGQRLLHGAAPGLPLAYNEAIHGVAIGPSVGSCGTAAYQRRPVYVTDIATDPLWADYRGLAAAHGLAACCSTPVIAADGDVLGTVAMYYRTPGAASPRDMELIHTATHLAGIVLERDRSDRRLRQSLEAEQFARGEAERASRMKDEFLATLSHELRTPLNAILGWTRILRLKTDVRPDIAQGVEVIERNARAQATIIQDLLDMSAIVSGKVRLSVQPMDLKALVEAALDTAMPAAQAKQVRLDALRTGLEGEVTVLGDAARLQQVLWNLLSNAIKFTPREGRIDVALEADGEQAWVRITDSGAGIAEDFLPYVFDRFRQQDASTTRRHGGLGLGLAIVKQIVELHAGRVTVASDGAGRGATFAVAIPLLAREAAGAPVARAESQEAVAGLRVLVVDDDVDARDMVRRLLEERRSEVSTAATVEEALRLMGEKRFDVLVSDIGMPGEDGIALIRRVRALEAAQGGDTPAVALTAYARPEDREKVMKAGFQLHVPKPIDPGDLFALVASVARRG
jgi:signal transduction histidine kinase/PAS domain-containing protein/ActR/RegA family two-component response regulator